jgi:hypothetical protein
MEDQSGAVARAHSPHIVLRKHGYVPETIKIYAIRVENRIPT